MGRDHELAGIPDPGRSLDIRPRPQSEAGLANLPRQPSAAPTAPVPAPLPRAAPPARPVPTGTATENATSDQIHLSVVIPAFNEQHRICHTIDAIRAYPAANVPTWELSVVDDGSTDDTASVVQARIDRDSRIKMVRLWRNRGRGYAERVGVLASRCADVLVSDADLSTPIVELKKLWTAGGCAALVIASRALPGSTIETPQGRLRRLFGRMGNFYIRALAVPSIRDTQCGFKLLRGEAARVLMRQSRLNGWGIDVEILHLCLRFGWPVVEVPVRWRHRAGSKLRPTAYLRVLLEVAYLRVIHRRTRATVALTPCPTGARSAAVDRASAPASGEVVCGGDPRFGGDAGLQHGAVPPRRHREHPSPDPQAH